MKKALCLLTIQFIFILCIECAFSQGYSVIKKYETGLINWTNRTISSKGIAIPDIKKDILSDIEKNDLFKKAKISASKNLFITMGKIPILSEKSVEQYISSRHDLLKQIQLMINNAKVINKEYLDNGSAEITLQINIDGGLAQLVLPMEIIQIEAVKTFNKISPEKESKIKTNTGLIVDARGLTISPVMSPRILDENGKEVYGPGFISREYAVQHGTVQYVKNFENNNRIGKKPIIVTGLKTLIKNNSDIIISTADSSKLQSSSKNLALLHEGKVIIVLDTPGF